MKICVLTPRFPFPQYGGDALRINEIAKYLKSKGHELLLVSLSDEDVTPVEDAHRIYNKVYFTRRNKWSSLVHCITAFFRRKPLQCGFYYSYKYRKLLHEVVDKEHPDMFVSHLLRMVPYLDELGVQSRSVVEMTDALSKTYTLSSSAKGVGLLKYIYAVEQSLIQQYESYVTLHYPKVVLVSQADVDYLKTRLKQGGGSLRVYSNGVDMVEKMPIDYNAQKICFVGNMRSLQNQDAVLYFVREIFPLIKKREPNVEFHVVGSLPPANIQALASNDIIVTGFVNDLVGYISDACCTVAPVRVAAGIQNKVLVAMGAGLPVIMSSLISNGIQMLKNGENCFICDEPAQYAEHCIEIMHDTKLRNRLRGNAFQMVKENYSWQECLNGYEIV